MNENNHPFIDAPYVQVYANIEKNIDLKRLPMYRGLRAFLGLLGNSSGAEHAKTQYPAEYEFVMQNFVEHIALYEAKRLNRCTQRYILTACTILHEFGNLRDKSIVEVGGAFGGLARVLIMAEHGIKKYTIVDHPKLLKLAREYLKGFEIVNFVNTMELIDTKVVVPPHDVFVSTQCLMETTPAFADYVISQLFPKCREIIIVDNLKASREIGKKLREYLDKLPEFKSYPFVEDPKQPQDGSSVYVGRRP